MTRQNAIDFINAMNAAQPFVPPIFYGAIINSEVARLAVAVANGTAICEVKVLPPQGEGQPQ
jgi:hypothetical protein